MSSSDDATELYLHDNGANRQFIASGPCTNDASWGVICDLDAGTPLKIYGSSAKDRLDVYFHGIPESMPIKIHGAAGDDQIKDAYGSPSRPRRSTAAPATTRSRATAATTSSTAATATTRSTAATGNDEVHGGAGDDILFGDHYKTPGADVLDGGPGFDPVDEWCIPDAATIRSTAVSLNGAADDGRPGEGDNVQSIEKFTFHVNATFIGTDAAENVRSTTSTRAASNLDGGGGNDTLRPGTPTTPSTAVPATTRSRAAWATTRSPAARART